MSLQRILIERRDQSSSVEVQRLYISSEEQASTICKGIIYQAFLDVWPEAGSIYVAFNKGEVYLESEAKVIIGVRDGKIADIEILLSRDSAKKLMDLLKPNSNW